MIPSISKPLLQPRRMEPLWTLRQTWTAVTEVWFQALGHELVRWDLRNLDAGELRFQLRKIYIDRALVNVTLIINILLYGSECWCLTETLLNQLRSFHHHCIRVMCGVTRWHVWRHRIRNAELRKRIRLETLDFYVELRQLRWAGHVARMGYERTPRKFLTSWVAHPRPHGRPQYTYGHALNKTLKRAGLPTDFKKWSEMAQNREAWREHIYGRAEYPSKTRRPT